jgi:uncharacterized protein (TIGR02444 family)
MASVAGPGGDRHSLGLWAYAVRLYGEPGVEKACISLQDGFGLDVDRLLFACWLGHRQRLLPPDKAAGIRSGAGMWQREVVSRLREARRAVRSAAAALGSAQAAPEAESLRAAILQIELEAERLELESLERHGWHAQPSDATPRELARTNLARLVERSRGALDEAALAVVLNAAFPRERDVQTARADDDQPYRE